MCLKKRQRPSEVDRPDIRAKRAAFLKWVRPIDPARLVVLDEAGANLAMGRSHAWVRRLVEARGALLRYLPPYSHDLSPIEPAWGLVKRDIRTHAPRTGAALRRVARRARHVVRAQHCRQWFAHAGYVN